jgi:hypothetical protein
MDLRKISSSVPTSRYLNFSDFTLPIPSQSLEIYLDAGTALGSYSGSGTTWTDISGNSRNFTWDANPSYVSGTAAYFNTNGRFASGPASNSVGVNNTSVYTVMLLALVNSNVQTGAFRFFSTNGADNSAAGRGIFSHLAWSDNNIYFDQGGCCNADTRTSVGSGGTATWNLWTFRRQTNGSTRNIIKNISTLATNTNAAANINLSSQVIRINNTIDYGATWNARIGAFITYSRNISDTEVAQIYNYYKPIYGLP